MEIATLPQNSYMSPGEVSREFNIDRRTVHALIKSGKLPAVQLSPKIFRILRSDLQKLMQSYADERAKRSAAA